MPALGQREAYEIGRFLRKRYDGFLNETYLVREIYVRSNDLDRCLQSAYCCLAGLYPPIREQVWQKEIGWQPIPVHSVPLDDDPYLKPSHAKCPAAKSGSRARAAMANLASNLSTENADLLAWLGEKTGIAKFSVQNISQVLKALTHAKAFGKRLPEWANVSLLNTMSVVKHRLKGVKYDSPLKAKFAGGLLLGEIVRRMEFKACTSKCAEDKSLHVRQQSKMHIYSGQGSTIHALLAVLKVLGSNVSLPLGTDTGGALIFELYNVGPKDFRVEMHYQWNRTATVPDKLVVPGCSEFACPIEEFVGAVRDSTFGSLEAWKKACNERVQDL